MTHGHLPPLEIPSLPRHLKGELNLDGSKSISNRALIMLALANADADQYLTHLSSSNDTVTLQHLLNNRNQSDTFNAGDAGTVFRFMAAFLAIRPGTQVLTGSARMKERPIGPLVTALRALGANIQYLEKEGYPPLQIGSPTAMGVETHTLTIDAGVSSQFLSALLMIGPYLPNGLELIPSGKMVSKPYLDLTMTMMQRFGADCSWENDSIIVHPGQYTPQPLRVEADWSAASYWYSFAALADSVELRLNGLTADSAQGDAVLAKMMTAFGIESRFEGDGVVLTNTGNVKQLFEWDFLECPDIAQTLAVTCAATGIQGLFTGLETLSIKETDRILAIKQELAKTDVTFAKLPPHFNKKSPEKTWYMVDGKAHWEDKIQIATYGDHRMAMAFAPLAMLGTIVVEHPDVVKKSYPSFWKDVEKIF